MGPGELLRSSEIGAGRVAPETLIVNLSRPFRMVRIRRVGGAALQPGQDGRAACNPRKHFREIIVLPKPVVQNDLGAWPSARASRLDVAVQLAQPYGQGTSRAARTPVVAELADVHIAIVDAEHPGIQLRGRLHHRREALQQPCARLGMTDAERLTGLRRRSLPRLR